MPPMDVVIDNPSIDAMKRKPNYPPGQQPPPPQPVTEKKVCILVDFDGHQTSGLWNVGYVESSGLTSSQIAYVVGRVASDYSFEPRIKVTTDEAVYNTFPENKRIRIIGTTSWQWYGYVGGVAYIYSAGWYGEKEAFVFTPLLNYNQKFVSDAVSHESYHTFGGRHNSLWDENCNKVSEYLVGDLIPGNSYYSQNPVFGTAVNSACCTCIEDSRALITNFVNQ